MPLDPLGYLLITNLPPESWKAPLWPYTQIVGRHPRCEIIIPNSYSHVSRQHLQIGSQNGNIWIQDLESSGGTLLNSVPVVPKRQTRVVIGDKLSLAGLELYVVSPEASVLDEDGEAEGLSTISGTFCHIDFGSVGVQGEVLLRSLSPAELEVVRWICRGLTTVEEIGKELFRSPHTVRTQLGSVFRKLDVHSREQLLALLRQNEIAWTKADSANVQDSPSRESEESLRKTEHSLPTVEFSKPVKKAHPRPKK